MQFSTFGALWHRSVRRAVKWRILSEYFAFACFITMPEEWLCARRNNSPFAAWRDVGLPSYPPSWPNEMDVKICTRLKQRIKILLKIPHCAQRANIAKLQHPLVKIYDASTDTNIHSCTFYCLRICMYIIVVQYTSS